jgi:MFS family permease
MREAVTERSRLWTPSFVAVVASQTATSFAFASFFLLPKFLKTELGAGADEIGIVMGAFGPAAIVSILLVGSWLDRVGRRPFIVAGAATMALVSAGYLLVDRVGPLLILLRVVQGFAFSMAWVASSTVAADEAPPQRLGEGIGMFGVAVLAMHAVAPAISEEIAEAFGWRWVFLTATAAGAVAVLLALRVRERPVLASASGSLWQLLRQPRSAWIVLIVSISGAAFATMVIFHQPYAIELGMTRVGGFFTAYATSAIAVRVLLGRLADRVGRAPVARWALLVYAAVVCAMAWLEPWMLVPLGAIFGAAHGLFYPAASAMAVEAAAPHERGKVVAMFNGAFNLGTAAANIGMGFVAEHAGYRAVFLAMGGAVLLAHLLLHVVRLDDPRVRAHNGQPARDQC